MERLERRVGLCGGPPPGGNMVRLWDSQTGVRLREWHFGAPPETAFFAGSNHIVVLSGGEALVYGTSLCEAGDVLIQLAGAQALRNTGGTKLGAPRRGWIAVTTACLRPREERRGSAKRRAEKHMPDYFRIASRAKPAARDRGFESISLQQPVCLSGEP